MSKETTFAIALSLTISPAWRIALNIAASATSSVDD